MSSRRYAPAWYGFALSREPLAHRGCSYLARARGQGYWRYELAGEQMPASWSEWADALLGPRAERLELTDSAGRYRGARVVGDRLAGLRVRRDDEGVAVAHLARRACSQTTSSPIRRALAILAGRSAKPGWRPGRSSARASPSDVRRCCARSARRTLVSAEADRQGAAGRHELRVVRAGAQGAARRSGGSRRLVEQALSRDRGFVRNSIQIRWSSVPLRTPPQRLTSNSTHSSILGAIA